VFQLLSFWSICPFLLQIFENLLLLLCVKLMSQLEVMNSLRVLIEKFDTLFSNIATVNLNHSTKSNQNLKLSFEIHELSDRKCLAVKELAGLLAGIQQQLLVSPFVGGSSVYQPQSALPSGGSKEAELTKTVYLLREYLVMELNRSESAQQRLIEVEQELVQMTLQRDALQKKLNRMESQRGGSFPLTITSAVPGTMRYAAADTESSSNAANVGSASFSSGHISSGVGAYVRKQFGKSHFFGLIVDYDDESKYYRVRTLVVCYLLFCYLYACIFFYG
jgi:hypothetical protein